MPRPLEVFVVETAQIDNMWIDFVLTILFKHRVWFCDIIHFVCDSCVSKVHKVTYTFSLLSEFSSFFDEYIFK